MQSTSILPGLKLFVVIPASGVSKVSHTIYPRIQISTRKFWETKTLGKLNAKGIPIVDLTGINLNILSWRLKNDRLPTVTHMGVSKALPLGYLAF
jgi:hypothetical protein